MHTKTRLPLALHAVCAIACTSKSDVDSGAPPTPQGTVQVSVDFLPFEDTSDYDLVTNRDGKLNPGEQVYVGVHLTNTGEVSLRELYGVVSFTDERIEGWEATEESYGRASAGGDNLVRSDYAPGGFEVRIPPFDAGESGTRINGTADIHARCGSSQDDVIQAWCRTSGAAVYPVFQGPVSLLVEEPATGPDALQLSTPTIVTDTNSDGTASPLERVSWSINVSKIREFELRGFTGGLSCTDPYLSDVTGETFDDWWLPTYDDSPRALQLVGTVAEDTPEGHTFTIELTATDILGDRHTLSVETPPVSSPEANLVFNRLEADSFVRPEEGELGRSNIPIDIIIENIGEQDLVNTWGELSSSDPVLLNGPYDTYGGNLSAGGGARYEYMVDLRIDELPHVYVLPLSMLITDELDRSYTVDFDWTLYTVPTPITGAAPTEVAGNGDGTPNPGESVEFSVRFGAVVESRWSSGMRGEYTVSTTDPHVRLTGDSTFTWSEIHKGDTTEWAIPVTLLASHPGGDVTLQVISEVWENPEYVPPEWVDTEAVTFTVE